MVLLPAPERPVSHTTKPRDTLHGSSGVRDNAHVSTIVEEALAARKSNRSGRAALRRERARRRRASLGDDLGAAELAQRVAENLRRKRKARGMSLDDLARASGVSRAALSQVETVKTNPTVGLLWKIAVGLGVPVRRPHRRGEERDERAPPRRRPGAAFARRKAGEPPADARRRLARSSSSTSSGSRRARPTPRSLTRRAPTSSSWS